jgi:hypothetical protein
VSCRATRDWLHRDVASLDESQRLLLDDHLTDCIDCRGDRERMRLVREVGASLPVPPVGDRMYQRAIAKALLEGNSRHSHANVEASGARANGEASGAANREASGARAASASGRGWRWLVPAGLALAATAIAAVVLARDDKPDNRVVTPSPSPTPTPTPSPPSPSPSTSPSPSMPTGDVVAEGTLLDGARELHVGDAVPTNRPLRTTADARVKLASFDIAIAPQSQLAWRGDRVVLDQGKIEIQSSSSSSTARVITERFEVELTGDVTVEPGRVHVDSGTARVSDRDGKRLAQLEAGGEWQPRAPKPSKPQASAVTIAEARAQLSAKDFTAAEKTAKAVLARSPSRAEEIDALMFLADLAQAMGELDVAVARYEGVATKFADVPAAESALYAAGRIEARRGRDAAARALFERYLDRYPNGRYADDVRRQRRQ